jgi:hypothetical protein
MKYLKNNIWLNNIIFQFINLIYKKNYIDYKIFDTLDNKFKKFINKNIKIENTIFVRKI